MFSLSINFCLPASVRIPELTRHHPAAASSCQRSHPTVGPDLLDEYMPKVATKHHHQFMSLHNNYPHHPMQLLFSCTLQFRKLAISCLDMLFKYLGMDVILSEGERWYGILTKKLKKMETIITSNSGWGGLGRQLHKIVI